MGGLITAEFRKIFSTSLWWGLLIPTVLLGFAWSWIFAAGGATISEGIRSEPGLAEIDTDILMFSVFGFARSANLTTIFPMIFGALAVTSENFRKTITTTYLTAPSRGAALGAKLIVYGVMGIGFGLVVAAMASAGTALGAGDTPLPDSTGWFLLFITAALETVLWTLFGVGFGALVGNIFAAVIGLLIYSVLVENVLLLALPREFPSVLPNSSASGMPGSVAAELFLDKLGSINSQFEEQVQVVVRAAAGAPGALDWWLNALIFLGYTVVFLVFGWLVSKQRDIT